MTQTPHHGKNLRSIRLLQGMKQEIFAREMGVSQQYISKLEKLQTISRKKLEIAAQALGISVETIDRFDENALLKPCVEAEARVPMNSVNEGIEYLKDELSRKDQKIEELEIELNKYRLNNQR
jgi:transcriptional regulator with XRE-family HTH domain